MPLVTNLFRDLIAAGNLQLVQSLQELHEGLQTPVRNVAAAQDERVDMFGTVRKVLWRKKQVLPKVTALGNNQWDPQFPYIKFSNTEK